MYMIISKKKEPLVFLYRSGVLRGQAESLTWKPLHRKTSILHIRKQRRLCFRYTNSTITLLFFKLLACFCDCTVWLVSDLVESQIVAFLMQRLMYLCLLLTGIIDIQRQQVSSCNQAVYDTRWRFYQRGRNRR